MEAEVLEILKEIFKAIQGVGVLLCIGFVCLFFK